MTKEINTMLKMEPQRGGGLSPGKKASMPKLKAKTTKKGPGGLKKEQAAETERLHHWDEKTQRWGEAEVSAWAKELHLRPEAFRAFTAMGLNGLCLCELARAYRLNSSCSHFTSLLGSHKQGWFGSKHPFSKADSLKLGAALHKLSQAN